MAKPYIDNPFTDFDGDDGEIEYFNDHGFTDTIPLDDEIDNPQSFDIIDDDVSAGILASLDELDEDGDVGVDIPVEEPDDKSMRGIDKEVVKAIEASASSGNDFDLPIPGDAITDLAPTKIGKFKLMEVAIDKIDLPGDMPDNETMERGFRAGWELLEPVILVEADSKGKRFAIVDGIRRISAYKNIGRKTIEAKVAPYGAADYHTMRMYSLILNNHRSPNEIKEVDIIFDLYRGRGGAPVSPKEIAKITGIPYGTVKRRLRLKYLSDDLMAVYKMRGMNTKTAVDISVNLGNKPEAQKALAETYTKRAKKEPATAVITKEDLDSILDENGWRLKSEITTAPPAPKSITHDEVDEFEEVIIEADSIDETLFDTNPFLWAEKMTEVLTFARSKVPDDAYTIFEMFDTLCEEIRAYVG